MSSVGRIAIGLAMALVLASAPRSAAVAGFLGSCEEPAVFSDAAVNVVLLPYTYPDRSFRELSAAARNLSTLIQIDTLGNARYGSLGVPALRHDESEPPDVCRHEEVLERIDRGPRMSDEMRQGGALALLWGRFMQSKGALFARSFLVLKRHETDDQLTMPVAAAGRTREVAVRLPPVNLAFAPRRIVQATLAEINEAFEQAKVLRTEPRDDAPAVDQNAFDKESFAFTVARAPQEGWMQLLPLGETPDGYVRIAGVGEQPIKKVFPELWFLDGAVGYLTQRVRSSPDWPVDFAVPDRLAEFVDQSMASFREGGRADLEPLATALSYAIPAALRVTLRGRASDEDTRGLLARALAHAPTDPDLLVFEAVARMSACCGPGFGPAALPDIEKQLYRALVLAPDDTLAPRALLALYAVMEAAGGPIETAELQRRVEKIAPLANR